MSSKSSRLNQHETYKGKMARVLYFVPITKRSFAKDLFSIGFCWFLFHCLCRYLLNNEKNGIMTTGLNSNWAKTRFSGCEKKNVKQLLHPSSVLCFRRPFEKLQSIHYFLFSVSFFPPVNFEGIAVQIFPFYLLKMSSFPYSFKWSTFHWVLNFILFHYYFSRTTCLAL